MRWRGALAALGLALVYAAVGEARVYPCGHGFFYRPSLRRCFPLGSPMANAWARTLAPRVHREAAAALVSSAPPFVLPLLADGAVFGREADDETRGRLLLRVALGGGQ